MNLATRCTECGTVFRVVQDQLKVSEGWVRCGRCSAVFNAQAELFELDVPQADPSSATALSPESAPVASAPTAAAPTNPDDWSPAMPATAAPSGPAEPEAPENDSHRDAAVPWPSAMDAVPEALGLKRPATSPEDLPDEPPQPVDDTSGVVVSVREPASLADDPPVQIDADEATPTPSFMQAKSGSDRWSRPANRKALMVAALALLLTLGLQAAVAWRDTLAAHVPALRPVLATLCQGLGCRVSPLRRIDRLAVESSGLSRIEGAPLHRLSLTLRNRADTAVLVPAIDLTVTDTQGKLVARRVLQLSELGIVATTIEAGAELPMQALLSTGDRRVSGYAVELFYP